MILCTDAAGRVCRPVAKMPWSELTVGTAFVDVGDTLVHKKAAVNVAADDALAREWPNIHRGLRNLIVIVLEPVKETTHGG